MMDASPLLLLVDFQIGLQSPTYGRRNNASAVANAATLLDLWRSRHWPVVYTRHVSLRAGSPLAVESPGRQIDTAIEPESGEPVFDKTTNSAFKAAGLLQHVRALAPREVVIVGVATDACVTASAREAKDIGYQVTVVADACATFDRRGRETVHAAEVVHAVALSALAASGIAVPTAGELAAQLGDPRRADGLPHA